MTARSGRLRRRVHALNQAEDYQLLESAIDARDPDAVALRADPLVNLLCRFAARLRAKVLDHGAAGASVPKAQCLQAVESLGAPARVLMIDHPNNDTYSH